jgi:hypothetical protein
MTDSLITLDEAEEVAKAPAISKLRLPLIILLGAASIIAATFFVMIIFTLRGTKTGVQTIFPYLNQQSTQGLQKP